jgi:hypothetical protein
MTRRIAEMETAKSKHHAIKHREAMDRTFAKMRDGRAAVAEEELQNVALRDLTQIRKKQEANALRSKVMGTFDPESERKSTGRSVSDSIGGSASVHAAKQGYTFGGAKVSTVVSRQVHSRVVDGAKRAATAESTKKGYVDHGFGGDGVIISKKEREEQARTFRDATRGITHSSPHTIRAGGAALSVDILQGRGGGMAGRYKRRTGRTRSAAAAARIAEQVTDTISDADALVSDVHEKERKAAADAMEEIQGRNGVVDPHKQRLREEARKAMAILHDEDDEAKLLRLDDVMAIHDDSKTDLLSDLADVEASLAKKRRERDERAKERELFAEKDEAKDMIAEVADANGEAVKKDGIERNLAELLDKAQARRVDRNDTVTINDDGVSDMIDTVARANKVAAARDELDDIVGLCVPTEEEKKTRKERRHPNTLHDDIEEAVATIRTDEESTGLRKSMQEVVQQTSMAAEAKRDEIRTRTNASQELFSFTRSRSTPEEPSAEEKARTSIERVLSEGMEHEHEPGYRKLRLRERELSARGGEASAQQMGTEVAAAASKTSEPFEHEFDAIKRDQEDTRRIFRVDEKTKSKPKSHLEGLPELEFDHIDPLVSTVSAAEIDDILESNNRITFSEPKVPRKIEPVIEMDADADKETDTYGYEAVFDTIEEAKQKKYEMKRTEPGETKGGNVSDDMDAYLSERHYPIGTESTAAAMETHHETTRQITEEKARSRHAPSAQERSDRARYEAQRALSDHVELLQAQHEGDANLKPSDVASMLRQIVREEFREARSVGGYDDAAALRVLEKEAKEKMFRTLQGRGDEDDDDGDDRPFRDAVRRDEVLQSRSSGVIDGGKLRQKRQDTRLEKLHNARLQSMTAAKEMADEYSDPFIHYTPGSHRFTHTS